MARAAMVFGVLATFLLLGMAQGSSINIKNECHHKVTACAQSHNDPIGQYELGAGDNKKLDFGPDDHWPKGAIWASVGGKCKAPDNPRAAADRNMANLAELHLPGKQGKGDDFYDLSNVDAYTIPLKIHPTKIKGDGPHNGFRCGSPTCTIDKLRDFCTGGNKLVKHPSGALTCRNIDGPGPVATPSTQRFKKACPTSYSFSKDDPTSTYTCGSGTDYEVVFCPGGGHDVSI